MWFVLPPGRVSELIDYSNWILKSKTTCPNPHSSPAFKKSTAKPSHKRKTNMMRLPFRCSSVDIPDPWPKGFVLPLREEDDSQSDGSSATGSSINNETTEPDGAVVEQWIDAVLGCSSQYGSSDVSDSWTMEQVIGPPRVERYGDNGFAWAPATIGSPNEWLEVQIAHPCQIQEVRIRETFCGGAFVRLQLYDYSTGLYVTVVDRRDEPSMCGQYPSNIRTETIEIPNADPPQQRAANFATDRMRLEFDQRGGMSWYEIDAIQVIGISRSIRFPRYQQTEREAALANHIGSLFLDESTADCTLIVCGQDDDDCNEKVLSRQFPVHRGILAARCPLFRAMLDNHELELGGEKVLKDIDPDLFNFILEWIYTGGLNTKLQRLDCVALTIAADYFQISDLTDYCVETVFVSTILEVDNAAVLYRHFDDLCIVEPLKLAALAYCGQHFLAVSGTPGFYQLSQPQLLAVVEHYRSFTSNN